MAVDEGGVGGINVVEWMMGGCDATAMKRVYGE